MVPTPTPVPVPVPVPERPLRSRSGRNVSGDLESPGPEGTPELVRLEGGGLRRAMMRRVAFHSEKENVGGNSSQDRARGEADEDDKNRKPGRKRSRHDENPSDDGEEKAKGKSSDNKDKEEDSEEDEDFQPPQSTTDDDDENTENESDDGEASRNASYGSRYSRRKNRTEDSSIQRRVSLRQKPEVNYCGDSINLNWMTGGGGRARGYYRGPDSSQGGYDRGSQGHDSATARKSRKRLKVDKGEEEDEDDDSNSNFNVDERNADFGENENPQDEDVEVSPKRYPSRRRFQNRGDESFPLQNGTDTDTHAANENEADDDEGDDLYSRIKRLRRTCRPDSFDFNERRHRRDGHRSYSEGRLERRQSPSEPVCKRLRDRAKMRRASYDTSMEFNLHDQAKAKPLFRKQKRKRRRSSSSSSSSDSDESQIRSPTKKGSRKGGRGDHKTSKRDVMRLMEVQPVKVDPSITFKSIGGLDEFINRLKEIVLFPLLYREFYERNGMSAPKGILLHGPPGTGKTLLARALANECSNLNGRKVTFFLRKGADLLNKFVGESERQLRMLFQQAALHQPSIIFFDEIDGLAPVRSAKSEQIHNSIVSSLLAEIDGLQDRGQVIVMGSTNRLDFVDPALRRPGRFDCELPIFLPTRDGRRAILQVHVSSWKDPVPSDLLEDLADLTIGFNGADLKYLCWQASMNSLKRTYPQIYRSSQKFLLNYDSIKVTTEDWNYAFSLTTPSIQRSLFSSYAPAQPLPKFVEPLLQSNLDAVLKRLKNTFPFKSDTGGPSNYTSSMLRETGRKTFVITGNEGSGINTFIVPAIFHAWEGVPVHILSFESLNMDGSNLEAALTLKCMEVMKQSKPSVCFLPSFDRLCSLLTDSGKEILLRMFEQSVQKSVLFLATGEQKFLDEDKYDRRLLEVFQPNEFQMSNPTKEEILAFFEPVFENASKITVVVTKKDAELPDLPLAPAEPTRMSTEEIEILEKYENGVFRELRIFLREILVKLARNKKFEEFTRPIDTAEVPDYLDIIEKPMDLETMMHKLNAKEYFTAKQFLDDVLLIYSNCLSYNPVIDESDKRLRLRAHELKDYAEKLIDDEMDSDFESECQKIVKAREERKDVEIQTDSGPSTSASSIQHTQANGNNTRTTIEKSQSANSKKVTISTPPARVPSTTTLNKSVKRKKRMSAWQKGSISKPKPKRLQNALSTPTSSILSVSSLPLPVEEEVKKEPEENDSDHDQMELDSQDTEPATGSTCSAETGSSTEVKGDPNEKVTASTPDTQSPIIKSAPTFEKKLNTLLKKTVDLCLEQERSVMTLVDNRFRLLRMVNTHQASENKSDLIREIEKWIQEEQDV